MPDANVIFWTILPTSGHDPGCKYSNIKFSWMSW